MKDGKAKFGFAAASAAKKNHRQQRAPLDNAGTRGVKPKTTPACPERIENQAETEDLAQLVIKYFGDEIREALTEVEASLSRGQCSLSNTFFFLSVNRV